MSTRKIIATGCAIGMFGLLIDAPVRAESLVNFAAVAQPIPRAGSSLYADPPAREPKLLQLHSLVTVIILESSTATSETETETEKETTIDLKVKTLRFPDGGLLNSDGTLPALKASASLETDNTGSTGRLHRIQTRLKAEVVEILPNQTMLVEGKKEIIINGESQIVTVSGYIQPQDLRPDGSVISDHIADMKISYTGRGTVTDAQKVGLLTSILSFLWPF